MLRHGLLMDYGGVMTTSMVAGAAAACDEMGVPRKVLRDIIVDAYAGSDGKGPVEQLETGLLTTDAFGDILAREIQRRCGVAVDASEVVPRMFSGLAHDEQMFLGVQRAREHGVRTALVSNSWGADSYPRDRLAEVFDVVVISGEVGLRKPDTAIFEYTLGALGLDAGACVFVDDLPANVAAAEALGMAGVVHAEASVTLPRVAALLGLDPGSLEHPAA